MTPLETALQRIKGFIWVQLPLPLMEDYLQTGNPRALAKINRKNSGGYWGAELAGALARPDAWTDQDRRAVDILCAAGIHEYLFVRLDTDLAVEPEGEDFHRRLREQVKGLSAEKLAIQTATSIRQLLRDGKPTSAGRYLLGLPENDLRIALVHSVEHAYGTRLLDFLLDHAPRRVPPLAEYVLNEVEESLARHVAASLLTRGGKTFQPAVEKRYRSISNKEQKFLLAGALAAFDPKKWGPVALADARKVLTLQGIDSPHAHACEWMLKTYPDETFQDVLQVLSREGAEADQYLRCTLLGAAVGILGDRALPMVHVVLKLGDGPARLAALPCLIDRNVSSDDAVIKAEIERGLREPVPGIALKFIGLAGRWKLPLIEDALWSALSHRSRPVRSAAARTLGRLGDPAIPKAVARFKERKADTRAAAVTVLTTINTPKALEALDARLDVEEDDDVRDVILLGLENAWEAAGRKVTPRDIQARIVRCAEKLKTPPAGWVQVDKLPALKYSTGKRVAPETVRYLLHRQSRAREIRADLEARPLFELIDRKSSGDFALEILKGFVNGGARVEDRWSLTVAGLLGDDRVVPLLLSQIPVWVDSFRGKIAEYAVQALALLGTDLALLGVDSMAIRYRSKYKNIGKAAVEAFAEAAQAAGLTPDELGDRVVPWLGFEPGKPRLIDKKIQVSIGLDFKLQYLDLEKRKSVAAPKKPELKELGASLREVVKAQQLRVENLMVRQRRWPAETWREMFLAHPLLVPFAVRLVWGAHDGAGTLLGTFRALEDRSLTDAADNIFEPPMTAVVGIVHPLELKEDLTRAWITHLADNEIEPPFPQMERPVVLVKQEDRALKIFKKFHGKTLNGMTFKGRAERLGWSRGSVVDAGGISSYRKGFPAAGVDVLISVEGMFIGMDMYSEITLGNALFVQSGSVKFGSYNYDEPEDEGDERLLPFGEVPPIVYSEAMGDLQRIAAGKSATEGA